MENSSKFMERKMSEVVAPSFNEKERGRALIKQIAGHAWGGKGDMVDRVWDAVRQIYPHAKWTRRRVRALWHREAATVSWREIRELEIVAEIESRRRKQIEEARREYDAYLTGISATLDRLAVQDQEFHRNHVEALCQLAGGPLDQAKRAASGQSDRHSSSRGAVRPLDRPGDQHQ